MRSLSLFGLLLLAGPLLAEPSEDERLLAEAKLKADGDALVEFFKRRILPDSDQKKAKDLIVKLGDDDFEVRQKASADLIAMGPAVQGLLQSAVVNDRDPEVVSRARTCLEIAERVSTPAVLAAAVRLLGQRRPEKAAELLLTFAPQTDSEYVRESIREALTQVAVRDKKADPAVRSALKDKHSLRRALAAEALFRAGGQSADEARTFLQDADPLVRVRVGLALAEHGHKSAVPALIGLLEELPLEQAWQVEDLLSFLAGEQAPRTSLNSDAAARREARTAWQAWWKKNEESVKLEALKGRPPTLGLTLIALNDVNGTNRLVELGRDGKPRWELENLQQVVDLQHLPGDKVLIAEQWNNLVSERNRQGEVTWKKQLTSQPVACRRLADGKTFIATRNQLMEVDAKGETTFTYTRRVADVLAACKLPDGDYLLVTRTGLALRVDKNGKEGKSFTVDRMTSYCAIDVTAKGNVLIPSQRTGRVVEYDAEGNSVWQANVQFPTSAQRLPNGHTLVSSMHGRKVIELDRSGKTVSETPIQGNPIVVRRR